MAALQAAPAMAQDPLPESEPNNTAATADTVTRPRAITGFMAPEVNSEPDVDYWTFFVAAGETLHLDIDANEQGSYLQPYAQLLAPDGITVLSEGAWWDGLDPHFEHVAAVAGYYYLRIRHGGTPARGGPDWFYHVRFAEAHCPVAEREPNDSRASAYGLTAGVTVEALSCPYGDRDLYRITVPPRHTLQLDVDMAAVTPRAYGCACDIAAYMDVFTADSTRVWRLSSDRDKSFDQYFEAGTTVYASVSTWPGGFQYGYSLTPRVIAPGPADPLVAITDSIGHPFGIATGPTGDLYVSERQRILRISPAGAVATLVSGIFPYSLAFDRYGNLLASGLKNGSTSGGGVVYRIAPGGEIAPVITDLALPFSMSVAPNGDIWVADAELRAIRRYAADGRRLDSYHTRTAASVFGMAFSPSGALHLAAGDTVFRFTDGRLEPVTIEPYGVRGLVFDAAGNFYVGNITTGRVNAYAADGGPLAAPFAMSAVAPENLAFGRNADGTPNDRLFIVEGTSTWPARGMIVEAQRAAVFHPGFDGVRNGCPTTDETTELTPGGSVTGASCPAGDTDVFRLELGAGTILNLRASQAPFATMELRSGDGGMLLASSRGSLEQDPHIVWHVRTAGTYRVMLRGSFGGPEPYTLSADTTLTVARAWRELVRPGTVLTAAEQASLDALGNGNGRYDLGDLRALLVLAGSLSPAAARETLAGTP